MRLLFVNIAYPKECYDDFYTDAKGLLSVPMNVYQWAIIEGLENNDVDYSLVSLPGLPAWPRYSHVFTPKGKMIVNGKERGSYIRYCDLPVIKQLSQKYSLKKQIRQWCLANNNEEQIQILVFTQQADKLSAIIELKKQFKNLKIAVIITDLIENAELYAYNRSLLKRIQLFIEKKAEHRLFSYVDKFILLSRQMEDFIPEAMGRSIVIEGIAKEPPVITNVGSNNKKKVLLYTGILEEYAGINQLVDAFLLTNNQDYKFVICGTGPCAEYVKNAAHKDSRIVYKGVVPYDEVVKLQRSAMVLINPRRPDGRITKYSFPSKTMEYMMSGTPMIGYKLEGIPVEYYDYMITPNDLTTEALSECIDNTFAKSQEELNYIAARAKEFIIKNKSSSVQVNHILTFLSSK